MDKKTQEIQSWWDENPFTLGAAGDYKTGDLVGRVPEMKLDLKFFEEIERRFRKHSGTGAQELGKPLLSKLVPFSLKGKKVLDIATGSGIFAVQFAKDGAEVTAIDLTAFATIEAKANFKSRFLSGEVIQMDAQNMTFRDHSYDFVNAWGCLMHMPNTEKAVKEIYRVLGHGGRVLGYMYNKSSWPFWFNIIFLRGILMFGLLRYGSIVRLTSRYSDGASTGGNKLTKFYTPKEVKKIFMEAGFTEVEVFPWDIGYEPDHWPMRSFPVFKYLPKKVKAWMAKRWGYGLIVKAKK
ncbi:class I SAM-dependent methyltransferase [Candidatus Parcubacteria bacterium]|nr:class I SAM-dependent methyltransferase [Candidatus Parcubacteria bacterium]